LTKIYPSVILLAMGIKDSFQQLGTAKKIMELQRQLAAEKVEVEEEGIRVVVRGDQKIEKIEIDGREEKKLTALINKAIQEAQMVAASKLREMGGGLDGLLGK